MAVSPELTAVLARIDAATNAIAARLDDLAAKLAAGMSPEETAAAVATLKTDADRLEAMGKTATNPTPDVPPVPPVTP